MFNENPVSLPKDLRVLRCKFLADSDWAENPKYLVVAVKLPTGAIELITNTEQIQSKIEYYKNAYDENFCLKTNPVIQIVGFMLA